MKEGCLTESIGIRTEIRQGDALSLLMCNLLIDKKISAEDTDKRIKKYDTQLKDSAGLITKN